MNLYIEVITDIPGREPELAEKLIIFWTRQAQDDILNRFGIGRVPAKEILEGLIKNFAVICLAYDLDDPDHLLIGHAEAGKIKDNPGWVEISVATDRNHRRKGIAGNLLNHLISACTARDIEGIIANVYPYNTAIKSLAQKISDQVPVACKYQQGGFIKYTYHLRNDS